MTTIIMHKNTLIFITFLQMLITVMIRHA